MTKKKAATVHDPVKTAIRAAWRAAHCPMPYSVEPGLEADRWVIRWTGPELGQSTVSNLRQHGLSFKSDTFDGVNRSAIVEPVDKLAATISVMTAAEPEPIPQVAVLTIANAIEANVDVADRAAMIGYIQDTPAATLALAWIREEHGRYDDAVTLARVEADKRREVRSAKTLVQTMPVIEEPPRAEGDTEPLTSDESELAQLRSRVASLSRELDAARDEIGRYTEGTARLQRVIAEQSTEIQALRQKNDQQSEWLKQATTPAQINADQIVVFIPASPPATVEAKEVTALTQGGEWVVAHRETILHPARNGSPLTVVYHLDRRQKASVEWRPSIVPVKAGRDDTRVPLAADAAFKDMMRNAYERAAEFRSIMPDEDIADLTSPFEGKEVA